MRSGDKPKSNPNTGGDSDIANGRPSDLTARAYYRGGKIDTPRHWVRGDPFATAFFNCLSAIFPQGERFMIRSVAKYSGKLSPKLNDDLKKFIQQEAAHSREHDDMNVALERSGYNISALEDVIKQLVSYFANKSDLTKLTATMCIEHLTAIVAAEVIATDGHLEGADPEQLPIWIWHALEEVEHKSVTFDCWQYVARDMSAAKRWALRCGIMLPISVSFIVNRLRGQVTLLQQDGYGTSSALWGAIRYGFSKGGLGRNVIRPWARFFKPGFHPDQIDDSALLEKAEKMFAELNTTAEPQTEPAERRKTVRLPKAA